MADIKRTVDIIFSGKDDVSRQVRNINKSFADFDGIARSVAAPLSRVTDVVIGLDVALTALAVGGMALAIRESAKFETSFQEITTLITETGVNFGELKQQILDYAAGSTQSIEGINRAVYTAISAGIDYKDALGSLSEAEKLSTAGKADLESTIRLVASTLNAYGATTEEASRYSNAFFRTVQLGQTTLPELADSIAKVTGIASNAGIPIEDLSGAIAALTASGIPTTEAMTGLKTVITAIVAPSAEAKKLFNDLGIEYGTSAISAKGLNGVLGDIYKTTGGNAEQMAKLLGGVRGFNAGITLAADNSGRYAGALVALREGQDVVTGAFEKMKATIDNTNQTLKNNVDLVLIQVGDRLSEGYKDIAGALTEVFASVSDAVKSGAFDELFEAIDAWGKDFTGLLRTIALNLPGALDAVDFTGLISALRQFGDTLAGLFDGINLRDPEDLAKALQAITDALTALVRVSDGIVQYIEPLVDIIKKAADEFSQMGNTAAEDFGKVLASAKLVAEAGTLVAGAIVGMKETGADASRVFDVVAGVIKVLWNTVQVAFDSLMKCIVLVIDKFMAIAQYATYVGKIFGSDMSDNIKKARESLGEFYDGINENQFRNMNELVDGGAQAWRGLAGATGKAAEKMNGVVKINARQFVDTLAKTGDKAGALLTSVQKGVEETREEIEKPWIPSQQTVDFLDMLKAEEDLGMSIDISLNPQSVNDTLMSVDQTAAEIEEKLPDTKEFRIVTSADGQSLTLTNHDLTDGLPAKYDGLGFVSTLKVKTEADKDSVKETSEYLIKEMETQADLLKTSIQYQAEVDIAQVEASTKIFEASIESVNLGIESTAELMQTAFAGLESSSFTARFLARRVLEEEMKLRKEEFALQKKLIEAKTKALEKGDLGFTIDTTGLEPALELVMWQILEKVQVRANETEAEFLLGLNA